MSKMFNKVLNFVGWETEEDSEETVEQVKEETNQPELLSSARRQYNNKIVSIHSTSHFKMVVMHPNSFDEAQSICDHLKNKKPIVVNLEDIDKDEARRIVDFLSGSVYALDGSIQKVSANIFIIAPNNVDVMGDLKDELKSKGVFPWVK